MSDNPIYSEVSDDKLPTFPNSSYAARPTDFIPEGSNKRRVDTNNQCVIISIIMLFICVTILVLGVLGGWIFFALEANKAEASISSLDQYVARHLSSIDGRFLSLENVSTQQLASFTQNMGNISSSDQQLAQRISNVENHLLRLENSTQQFANYAQNLDDVINQQVARHVEGRFLSLENSTQQIANYTQNLGNFVNTLYEQVGQNFSSINSFLQQLQCTSVSSSCSALPPSSPSGYYCIRTSNGSAVRVYCDMTRSCGGITGGWMRVAALNMTNRSQECPNALIEREFAPNLRTCSRPEENAGCSSLYFSSNTISYSKVCGSVIAYQYGAPDAFRIYYNNGGIPLDGNYVSGVSITSGTPRQHIWTFVAARDELVTHNWSGCDCLRPNYVIPPTPPYVGNDYFCDSGSRLHFDTTTFYGDDPLWDGAGCESVRGFNNSCCTFNNPPWFYKQLSQPTADDIEMRICRQLRRYSDLAVQKFELYVQ